MVRRHPIVAFFALAYGLSWSWWIPMALSGARVRVRSADPSHFPGLLGPAVAAAIVTLVRDGKPGLRSLARRLVTWPVRIAWTVVASLSPLIVLLAVALALHLLGGDLSVAGLGRMNGLPELGPVSMWLVLTAWNGFGEETGWRGFALPHLQERLGPLGGTLVLALLWAGWHVPTFFVLETYRSLGLAMLPGFVLGLTAGAIFLAWLYHRTGGSILAVAVWHGSFNLATATEASRGLLAALASTVVMVWGTALLVAEIRSRKRGGPSVLGGASPADGAAGGPRPAGAW